MKASIKKDLKSIIEVCNKLINNENITKWEQNRAKNILIILKYEFAKELA